MWEKTVICDVKIAQCEDGTVKCEKKVIWCSKLPTSRYRTPLFLEGYHRITHNNCILFFFLIFGNRKILYSERNSHISLHLFSFFFWLRKYHFILTSTANIFCTNVEPIYVGTLCFVLVKISSGTDQYQVH